MKKLTKGLLYGIMTMSFLICALIGIRRAEVENENRTVQIGIKYEDILKITYQSESDIASVLKELKEAGVSTLFVKENTLLPSQEGALDNYASQGYIKVLKGYQLVDDLKMRGQVEPPFTYIGVKDTNIAENIYNHLQVKNIPVNRFTIEDEEFIQIREENSLKTIGVGFPYEDLKIATALGYTICPEIRTWENPTSESLTYVTKELRQIERLGPIYFLGDSVPGYNHSTMAYFVARYGLGFKEFKSYNQLGYTTLAEFASKINNEFNVIREFGDDNIKNASTLDLLSRYELALSERNDRSFLFNLPNHQSIRTAKSELIQNLKAFKTYAEKHGYTVSNKVHYHNLDEINTLTSFFAGLGTICVFVLLLGDIGLEKKSILVGITAIIVYGILLKINPDFTIKLMALFAAVICPIYAVLTSIGTKVKNYKETIIVFLKVCAISFMGSLSIIGLLSSTPYALGIDLFKGVKLAYLAPIITVVALMLYYKEKTNTHYIKELLTHQVTYLALGLGAILFIFFLVYAIRSGNSGSVPYIEKVIRDSLTSLLGVRPRTKEWLIGYPLLIALIYFGYKDKYLPVLAVAMIGPVSLVNTYAHVHTPLIISLIRSIYGIIFGIAIGFIFVHLVQLAMRIFNKWI